MGNLKTQKYRIMIQSIIVELGYQKVAWIQIDSVRQIKYWYYLFEEMGIDGLLRHLKDCNK